MRRDTAEHVSAFDYAFVTGSQHKAKEASEILQRNIRWERLDLVEVQSLDINAIVEHKASAAYKQLGGVPVIVEDTGLYLSAWGGLPGPLIKWFEVTVGPTGIALMLDAFEDRRATAKTVVAVYDGTLKRYVGEMNGRIAHSARGSGGFGWDTIFVPDGFERTLAEMSPVEKNWISMRRKAFEAMAGDI
jgi:non-canonical purine NTP pyrophosphatase (RdgB/HAM1 family)